MLQLVKSLEPIKYTPRVYLVAKTDRLSEQKAIQYEQSLESKGQYYIHRIPRAREVGQSWSTVPFSVLYAIVASVKIFLRTSPELILCNGPGSCIPICLLAYIPRFLGIKKIEIIYIESFARVQSLSLTGRLLYPFVDRFLVQWPQLSQTLDKAEYKGVLV
ncbi:oligosaccharide biosynthesis protein Alg14-like protein [Mycotypha africana]|uniref:oligosaccharide biosynthesis protein Alg14-like protein n=1 Tax=Mycotypha africana TaxID=64632 RepID=UPI0022FFD65B|nr:oligosaccharide biosynthesis protein Alg14-like protein [Mycotypha africana]KAI8971448.1 oligosaccharide biosynthesis protein Alg14-like protein [Mycotypha africana]